MTDINHSNNKQKAKNSQPGFKCANTQVLKDPDIQGNIPNDL